MVLKYRYSEHVIVFVYWAITICGAPFQGASANQITFYLTLLEVTLKTHLTYNFHPSLLTSCGATEWQATIN